MIKLPDIDYTTYPTPDLREMGEAYATLADLLTDDDSDDAHELSDTYQGQARAVEQVLQARDTTGRHGPVRREIVAVLVERGYTEQAADTAVRALWGARGWPIDAPAPYYGDVGDSLFLIVDAAMEHLTLHRMCGTCGFESDATLDAANTAHLAHDGAHEPSWYTDQHPDEQPEPLCRAEFVTGPDHDLYATACDLSDGHPGRQHEGPHPLADGKRISWTGGGTAAGDRLPYYNVRSHP